jgi:hypothetical protein
MDWRPGGALATKRLVDGVRLGVDDARLDVPEAVVARVALAGNRARMQMASPSWFG